ncbi:MAG: ATP-binding cassette domain-containing protein [Bacillota bacterium]
MIEEVLRLSGVTYWEEDVPRLEDFHLSVRAGEVIGLVPVLGHGTTALLNLLRENRPLQKGYIYYREELINNWRTPNPRMNRISVIRSTSSLVEGLTVADNIFVLRRGFRSFLIRKPLLHRQLQPFLDEIGMDLHSQSYIEELSPFQRVVVELVKAVVDGSKLIILRDIGTFISESELYRLHEILRYYVSKGISFLYIGFHLEELSLICNRIAMMVNGTITKVIADHKDRPMYTAIYEGKMRRELDLQTQSKVKSKCVFRAENLSGGGVKQLSFSAMAGECLVLQDLDHCVFESLIGMLQGEKAIEGGGLFLNSAPFVPEQTRKLAIVPPNPTKAMLFPELSYFDNLCFTLDHRLKEIWGSPRTQKGILSTYEIASALSEKPLSQLSVTEEYDLVYRRILVQSPEVLFCVQPFQGANMELRMHIWELLQELMAEGIAVVILAVNLSDTLALASGLIRIYENGECERYERREFAEIPFVAPWVEFIKEAEENRNRTFF